METGTFNFSAWISKHGTDVTRPRIDNVIATLKHQGIKEFAATGYCFSGISLLNSAFNQLATSLISHSTKFKQTKVPLLINSCKIDQVFPIDSQAQADVILGGGLTKTDLYRREYFDGCTHGFAVRGDMSNPKVKAGKEGAFKAIVGFFLQYFPQT
ncbi:hypothetical protein EV363DRAFT_1309421 [Boletus edulis]|nr:hypothetical protein EV363DRAFT_1309421 [Boletus edulis]